MANASEPISIAGYGLIGNCRTVALVSKRGSMDWACFPRFDSPSFFARILDERQGGFFSLAPSSILSSEQVYLHDTNVLATRFDTGSGRARLLDFFSVTSESEQRAQLCPEHEILRVVEGLEGEVEFEMRFAPKPHYAKARPQLHARGSVGICCDLGGELLVLRSSLTLKGLSIVRGTSGEEACARFSVKANERAVFSLVYSSEAPAVLPPLGVPAFDRLTATIAYWRGWLERCPYSGPYEEQVRRSALALKLLAFAPSGVIIAAPTTSLPETLGGVRNWDYRYCWLRDASFTVRALVALGYTDEARAFVNWMLHSTHLTAPRVRVLYSLYGEDKIPERTLDWFKGYKESKPVRIGNAADQQFQLDVYGEVLDAIEAFSPEASEFDRDTRNFILSLGDSVLELWDKPDDGIWEVRSGRVHHTHSKVLAWVALDRLSKLALRYRWRAPVDAYQTAMAKIRARIEDEGYNHELQSYVRTFGGAELDASLLVMPLVGYCEAHSPRMNSTRRAIASALSENGLVYRYIGTDDGLPGREGAFGICNFWLAESFARAGARDEAVRWMDAMVGRLNGVGLFSEEIDARSGEYLGNYPQAFTHIGLIRAALAIAEEVSLQ